MSKKSLFIGMPVYNGENFIAEAIESIRKQVYVDWEMLISDNCSTDNTGKICSHFVSIDKRIQYYKQSENIGAIGNFKFLLDKADSKYFMWASYDDIWLPNFISSCINTLENDKNCSLAFTNIVNIDSYGRIIREYSSFKRFGTESAFRNIINFLREHEVMGKANLIYGIYRLNSCRDVWKLYPLSNNWGSDMVFVLAFLSRNKIAIEPKILFHKRVIRSKGDQKDRVKKIIVDLKQPMANLSIPQGKMLLKDELRVLKGTKLLGIALIILSYRLSKIYLQNLIIWRWKESIP